MNKTIVFIVSQSLLIWRGVERWVTIISRALWEKGFRVYVISFSSLREKYVKDRAEEIKRYIVVKKHLGGVKWFEIRSLDYSRIFMSHSGIRIPIYSTWPVMTRDLIKIIRILRTADVIYIPCGSVDQAVNLTLLIILFGGVKAKVIWGLHSRPSYKRFTYARTFLRMFSKWLRAIHTVNIVDYIVLKDLLGGFVNVLYIPNFVDTEFFNPTRSYKNTRFFQILFVGALLYDKGADIVLEVAKILKESLRDSIKIVVTSTGGPLEELFKQAEADGILEFKRFASDNELAKLYASSHCFLAPSRVEAFNLAVLEALASGTPVISSDIPAFRVTVKEGFTGFRVANFNPKDYAKTILKLYSIWKEHRELYETMCINTHNHAEKFSIDNISKIFIKLFNEI